MVNLFDLLIVTLVFASGIWKKHTKVVFSNTNTVFTFPSLLCHTRWELCFFLLDCIIVWSLLLTLLTSREIRITAHYQGGVEIAQLCTCLLHMNKLSIVQQKIICKYIIRWFYRLFGTTSFELLFYFVFIIYLFY